MKITAFLFVFRVARQVGQLFCCSGFFVVALAAAHRIPRSANSQLLRVPYATNAFSYEDGAVRIFSVDWTGLSCGHSYEIQSSTDGKSWRHRTTTVWTDPDPSSYWRTQFPTLPPAPFHTTEVFRLEEKF